MLFISIVVQISIFYIHFSKFMLSLMREIIVLLESILKLFTVKPKGPFNASALNGANKVTVDQVEMTLMPALDNLLSQLKKMLVLKPSADAMIKAIEVLEICKLQINKTIGHSEQTLSTVEQRETLKL